MLSIRAKIGSSSLPQLASLLVVMFLFGVLGVLLLFRSHANPSLSGDITNDGVVDEADLQIIRDNYGQIGASANQGDLNSDGVVNIVDASILFSHWGASDAGPPITGKYQFGVATGAKGFPGQDAGDRQTFLNQLADMQNLGVKWVRMTFPWKNVQRNKGDPFDFSDTDFVINSLDQYNMHVIVTLTNAPEWSADNIPPNKYGCTEDPAGGITFDIDGYAAYAEALADQYKSHFVTDKGHKYHVEAWEMGNEPNHAKDMFIIPNICEYTKLMHETYGKIHQIDPSAVIMTGGFGGNSSDGGDLLPDDFLEQIYQENKLLYGVSVPRDPSSQCTADYPAQVGGSAGIFDALGYHPYSRLRTASEDAQDIGPGKQSSWYLMVNTVRPKMVCHGDASKKIWATEYGSAQWPSRLADFQSDPHPLTQAHYNTLVCELLPPYSDSSPDGYPSPVPAVPGYPECSKIYDDKASPPKLITGHSGVDMLRNSYSTFATYNWAGVMAWFDYNDDVNPEDSFVGGTYNNGDFRGLRDSHNNKTPLWQAYKDATTAAP